MTRFNIILSSCLLVLRAVANGPFLYSCIEDMLKVSNDCPVNKTHQSLSKDLLFANDDIAGMHITITCYFTCMLLCS